MGIVIVHRPWPTTSSGCRANRCCGTTPINVPGDWALGNSALTTSRLTLTRRFYSGFVPLGLFRACYGPPPLSGLQPLPAGVSPVRTDHSQQIRPISEHSFFAPSRRTAVIGRLLRGVVSGRDDTGSLPHRSPEKFPLDR